LIKAGINVNKYRKKVLRIIEDKANNDDDDSIDINYIIVRETALH
jgi:hypothetical protein